jgi:hypothetical protein
MEDRFQPELERILRRYWPFKTYGTLVPEMGSISCYWLFKTYFWRSLVMVASLRWKESCVTDPLRLTFGDPWWWWRAWGGKNLALLALQDLLLTSLGDGGEPEMRRISRYWPFKTYFWWSLVIMARLRWKESRVTDPSRLTSDEPWWWWRAWDEKNLTVLTLHDLLLAILGDGGESEMERISRYWRLKTYFWRALVMVASLRWEESRVTDPSRLTSDDPWWWWQAWDGKNLASLTLPDLLLAILGDGGKPEMERISHHWPFQTYFWRSLVMVASLRWEESHVTDPSRLTSGDPWWSWRAWSWPPPGQRKHGHLSPSGSVQNYRYVRV